MIQLDYEYFIPKDGDGNISFSTQEKRIEEALKLKDGIQFSDGKIVKSKSELIEAINNYSFQKSITNKSTSKSEIGIPLIIVGCILMVIGFICLKQNGYYLYDIFGTFLLFAGFASLLAGIVIKAKK